MIGRAVRIYYYYPLPVLVWIQRLLGSTAASWRTMSGSSDLYSMRVLCDGIFTTVELDSNGVELDDFEAAVSHNNGALVSGEGIVDVDPIHGIITTVQLDESLEAGNSEGEYKITEPIKIVGIKSAPDADGIYHYHVS